MWDCVRASDVETHRKRLTTIVFNVNSPCVVPAIRNAMWRWCLDSNWQLDKIHHINHGMQSNLVAFRLQESSGCADPNSIEFPLCCHSKCHLRLVAHALNYAGTKSACDQYTLQIPYRLCLWIENNDTKNSQFTFFIYLTFWFRKRERESRWFFFLDLIWNHYWK